MVSEDRGLWFLVIESLIQCRHIYMKRLFVSFFCLLGLLLAAPFGFAMTSTNYLINWDSINSGGDDVSSSTNYRLRDTVGEQATGFSTSTLYSLSAGYRTGDQNFPFLTFSIGTQENATQVAYSAINIAGKTIAAASAAGFAVGDYVGAVENLGLSQKVSVGQIVSIASNTIEVDQWGGVTSTMSAIPGGGDDFIYRLNGSSAVLGTLTSAIGKTSITTTNVSTDATNGYTLEVLDDGNLRTGSASILNVADGAVTIGSEEYGAAVFGGRATSTGSDFAFSTSTPRQIQISSTEGLKDRVVLVYKVSISDSTAAGSYGHLVYYRLTPNY